MSWTRSRGGGRLTSRDRGAAGDGFPYSTTRTGSRRARPMGTTTTRPRLVFTLAVLLGINTMNFFDRQVLPAVQEKIRPEWGLSNSELGWLGTAFILLYAVV